MSNTGYHPAWESPLAHKASQRMGNFGDIHRKLVEGQLKVDWAGGSRVARQTWLPPCSTADRAVSFFFIGAAIHFRIGDGVRH